VSAALAMTYAGARHRTEAQMARVLHFDLPQERLHPAFAALGSAWEAEESPVSAANALWAPAGLRILDEFRALTAERYGAWLEEVDFAGDVEEARRTINRWGADHTDQRVPELFRRGDLDPATGLVLTNAIRFTGRWATEFDAALTRNAPFRIDGSEQLSVPFMRRTAELAFASTEGLDLLELPYEDGGLSMIILLPRDADGLGALERSLTSENLDGWLGLLRSQTVRVSLPRVRLGSRLDLSGALQAMGMTDAFSASRADFSGITGGRELFISLVTHEAQMEVDEAGTEAAAGTGVVLKRGRRPVSFVADHPFIFLIRDRETGSILFLGRVVDPTA
jgi:serpin B